MTSSIETKRNGGHTAATAADRRDRSTMPGAGAASKATANRVERHFSFPRWIFAVPAIVLSLYAYYPITQNYFFGDDLLNLYRIVNLGFVEFAVTPYAGHILLARNAIYYLCYELFGTHAEYYFYLVLFTHLVNVFLLFQVIRTLTHGTYLACFGAALWGMSPINEGALGWYSVYGQVLVGTGVAWFLYVLARIANGHPPGRWTGIQVVVVLVVTATMFGTGIGVALTAPFVAFVLLPATPARRRLVRTLSTLLLIVPLLYFGLGAHDGSPSVTTAAHFFLSIWDSVLSLFLNLFGNGIAGLLLGVVHGYVGYPSSSASVAVGLYLAALVAAFARGSQPARRQLLACLLLAASGYIMVALGRGPFIARGMRAEVFYRATRYQYFAPMLMAIALCTMVAGRESLRNWTVWQKQIVVAAALAILLVSHASYAKPIDHHQSARRHTLDAVARIYELIRQAPGAEVYIPYPSQPFRGVGPLLIGKHHLFPGWAGLFIIFFPDNVVEGKRVRFVVDDPLFPFADGRRTKDLFVMTGDVPGA